jgi:hypothetical protein
MNGERYETLQDLHRHICSQGNCSPASALLARPECSLTVVRVVTGN